MVGETLSHYKILEPLGAGGMGELFVAEDLRLGRRVALKLLPAELADDRRSRARLEREARALARLQHPAIVTVHDVDEQDGILFLVMELVRGERLDQRIARADLEIGEILEVACAVAAALAAAHEVGVIHRDLKPANVMLTPDGVKVLDFGLAVLRQEAAQAGETETLTQTGLVAGTLPYMAPEQLRGQPPDPRSDLFSVGVMLFEMAAGRRPFRGSTAADLSGAILNQEPPTVTALRPDAPADLARIVRHCLQKDPERRYQTAKGLRNELAELEESLHESSPTPTPARQETAWPSQRWNRTRVGLAALAAALFLVAVLAMVLTAGRPSPDAVEWVANPEARALLAQADRYESRGDTPADLELAEKVLRRALAREPGNPYLEARLAALLTRIQVYYPQSGRREEIESLAGRALVADPEMVPALVARGQLALMDNDWQEAEGIARQIVELRPSAHESYGILGRALLAQGRTEEAIREASRGLEHEGTDPGARLGLARVLLGAGRFNEAAVHYEKVIEVTPDSPNALSNLGSIYAMTGREIAAIPLFTRLLELKEDDYAASNLGFVLYNLGRFEEAVDAFARAHRIKPENPSYQLNLSDAYEALGNRDHSREWLERALASYDVALGGGGPRHSLLPLRAVAAAKLGRADEARGNVEEALRLRPSDPTTLFYAAQVAALLGDEEELLDAMGRALAAGFPREPFHKDAAFAAYRDEPAFARLLFEPSR